MKAKDNAPGTPGKPLQEFRPKDDLRKRVMKPGNGAKSARRAIADAEQAMESLSDSFNDWIAEEVGKLVAARDNLNWDSADGPDLDPLFCVAHDLKGQAATLGYPMIGQVCASLCRLMDAVAHTQIPNILVDQHVDAVRAMAHEGAKGDTHATGTALVKKLTDVVEHFVSSWLAAQKAKAQLAETEEATAPAEHEAEPQPEAEAQPAA